MGTKRLIFAAFGVGLSTLAQLLPAAAENGVTADKITLGQVAALDGPAAALGQGMRDGLLAAFAEPIKPAASRATSSS
jgi:branched-chain amino acid transport system substrate-binding protein